MMKNYLKIMQILSFRHLLCLFFIFGHQSNAQYTTPAVGCTNTDLADFGADSNNDATRIQYDDFVSSSHTTIIRTSDGSFQTWDKGIGNNDVTNILAQIPLIQQIFQR